MDTSRGTEQQKMAL